MKKYVAAIGILLLLIFCCPLANAQQYQVPVYTVTSSVPPQPGTEPGNCIDGDDNTIFHTNWNISGVPDTLDFYFTDTKNIDSIQYTPRQTGLNGSWGNVEIWYSTSAAPSTFVKAATLSWSENNAKKYYVFPGSGIANPYIIRFVAKSAYGNFSSCAEMNFYSAQPPTSDNGCSIPTDGLSFLTDVQIPVSSGTASSHQSGQDISNSFDGNTSTLYHSNWSGGGFPISLTYNFTNAAEIDYLVYTPRQDGNANGLFGNVEIWYKTTTNNTYVKLMDYNCGQKSTISRIDFPQAILHPTSIQIRVQDGGNNFASCAEMQFFKSAARSTVQYADIFTDDLYSSLKPGITQTDIDTISVPFFQALAQCIFNGTYNSKYRVQQYTVYPNVSTTATSLKTSTYNQFENPTGIFFQAGTTAVIFADSSAKNNVSLRVRDFAKDDTATDDSYILSPGCNIINIKHDGLSYISYYNDNATLPPVKINIVSGEVNGYFDATTDNDADWPSLLSNTTYPNIDIKGKYINLMYNKAALKANTPFNGLELVAVYDSIVRNEHQLMGLVKYNRVPKNHMFAYSNASGGYYAGGLGAHFDLSWGTPNITSISGIDVWGVSHELGHINQARPGMKWIGMTEVTNNMYSAWNQYTMRRSNKYTTRLELDNGQADSTSPNIIGGRFNSYLDASVIRKVHIQTQDVFCILTPLWQLELYYQVAGACKNAPTLLDELTGAAAPPSSGVDYAHWMADVFEKVRNTNETGLSNGQLLMNFVKNTCDAVQEDLTGFFINTGFLRPIDMDIDDYGIGHITITQNDIDTLVASIKSKGYNAPVSPVINYISSNSVNAFKNKLPVEGTLGQGVTELSGAIKIDHSVWKNVAVFETYAENSLIHLTLVGTGDATNSTTTIQYPDTATSVYAVGFDGAKTLVYPVSVASTPVKFVKLTATANTPTSVLVQWQIGVEQNVNVYEIEKSTDGKNFFSVGQIKAHQLINYQYTDDNTNVGTIYYRIKSIDNDGSAGYSDIASVNIENNTSNGTVYPNPFGNTLTVSFEQAASVASIRLYNLLGKLILTQNINANSTSCKLNTQSLPSGVYFLKLIKTDGSSTMKKVIKK